MGTGVPLTSRRPAAPRRTVQLRSSRRRHGPPGADAKRRFVAVFNRLGEFAADTGYRYVS
jgi:hypothetical protein